MDDKCKFVDSDILGSRCMVHKGVLGDGEHPGLCRDAAAVLQGRVKQLQREREATLEAMGELEAEFNEKKAHAEQAVRRLREAAQPFLNLKDKGHYAIGVITMQDIEQLEVELAAGGETTAPSPPSAG